MKMLKSVAVFLQVNLLVLILVGTSAHAKRYSIILNENSSIAQEINQIRSNLFISKSLNLNTLSVLSKSQFPESEKLIIEDVLVNSQVIVARSFDGTPLSIDSSVNPIIDPKIGFIEEDLIHPNPNYERFGFKSELLDEDLKDNLLPFDFRLKPWGLDAIKATEARALVAQASGVTSGASGSGGLAPATVSGRVMILDSGIEKLHPEFLKRIIEVKDFTEDGDGTGSDNEGHGTHVAGTIAGTSMGVSPLSKIYSGKVCSEEGCSGIAIAQGLEWAAKTKVDVVNLSLGGGQLSAVERRALSAAEAQGVTVIAASGNDGRGKVSFPGAAPTAFAVGAVDRNFSKADFSNWGPELDIMGPGVEVISSVPLKSAMIPKLSFQLEDQVVEATGNVFAESAKINGILNLTVVSAGLGKPEDFKGLSANGKAVLIYRGEISFSDKFKNALLAGAAAVIFYNNTAGMVSGKISPTGDRLTIPVLMIEQQVGETVAKALVAKSEVNLQLSIELSDYDILSGTSMATPHVSGVVALMKSANPKLTPLQVRTILKSTATTPLENKENKFGAGIVDAEKAVAKALELR